MKTEERILRQRRREYKVGFVPADRIPLHLLQRRAAVAASILALDDPSPVTDPCENRLPEDKHGEGGRNGCPRLTQSEADAVGPSDGSGSGSAVEESA